MKKFIFLLTSVLVLVFVGCNSTIKKTYSINDDIYNEISKIENVENLHDETIKVLSIIYRTNLKEKNLKKNKNFDNNNRIYNLIKQTKNETLNKNINVNTTSKMWKERINKSDILDFLKKQNLTTANLNDIKIIEDNKNTSYIIIANNKINFLDFLNYFKLPSNKNIKIDIEKTFITISGYGVGYNFDLNIEDIENLSKNNLNYSQIIKNLNI